MVDLVRVFNEFKQTRALNQKMAEHREKLNSEKDKRQTEINALREQTRWFRPGQRRISRAEQAAHQQADRTGSVAERKFDEISGDHLRG